MTEINMHRLFICTAMVFAYICISSISMAEDIHLIEPGECKEINKHGVCKTVTNNAAKTIMVPSKFSGEWDSFLNGAPAHTDVQNCSGGVSGPFESKWVSTQGSDDYFSYSCDGDVIIEDSTVDNSVECRNLCKSYAGEGATCCEYWAKYEDTYCGYVDSYGCYIYQESCKLTKGKVQTGYPGLFSGLAHAMNKSGNHSCFPPEHRADDPINYAKVLCTYYHRRGLIADLIFRGDNAYAESVHPNIVRAYHAWAKPLIKWLRKREGGLADRFVYMMVRAWAQEMAHRTGHADEGSTLGWWLSEIGEPLHYLAGYFIPDRHQKPDQEKPVEVAQR